MLIMALLLQGADTAQMVPKVDLNLDIKSQSMTANSLQIILFGDLFFEPTALGAFFYRLKFEYQVIELLLLNIERRRIL